MAFINDNNRWILFVTAFLFLYLYLHTNIILKFLISILFYAACGGWRFLKVLILTFPRDMKGLKSLITVNYYVWRMKRNNETIPDIFESTVRLRPNAPAFLIDDETWSFTDVDRYSNKVANHLLTANVRPGDAVALLMENRPAYVAIWIGVAKIGAVPALLNFNLRGASLVHSIQAADAVAIVCGVELTDALAAVQADIDPGKLMLVLHLSGIKHPVGVANGGVSAVTPITNDNTTADDKLIWTQSDFPPSPLIRTTSRSPHDALLYIYTSGTTGLPKAAKVSHTRFLTMSLGVHLMLRLRESDIVYNPLPLYHTAGGMIGVGQVLLCGSCMALRRRFSASAFWTDCVKYRATAMQYIGEVCRYLLAQPQRPEELQHRVRVAFGNGIRPQIWTEFQSRFRVPLIGEFYGATESNANMVNNMNKVGAVGFGTRIAPFMYPISLIRVDSDTGQPLRDSRTGLCVLCRPNEIGQLVGKIRDRDITGRFDGYVNDQATDKKIARDVFRRGDRAFLTGDLLSQDELGYFYFKDRLGDTFRWKGENVSTAEVEAIISNMVGRCDCVVYGVEIPNCEGRAGMAAIVAPQSSDDVNFINPEELTKLYQRLKVILPSYACPVFLRLLTAIEMTGTFKMKKVDLVNDGFNIDVVKDQIFYLNPKDGGKYELLDSTIFQQILSGVIRF